MTPDNLAATEWVLVAAGFHHRGGMERANAALASYLLDHGARVHLVGHECAEPLLRRPGVEVHLVRRPAGIDALTDVALTAAGRRVARGVLARCPSARVVVNGGNCPWPDVNWVHYVHHAWPPPPRGPAWFRLKETLVSSAARRAEARALRAARLIVANSTLTRRDVVNLLGIDAARVRTVYLGAESSWMPAGDTERAAARRRFGINENSVVVSFVGGLGHDERKGFDVILATWARLCDDPTWRAHLLVAGGGRRLTTYRRSAAALDARNPVTFLGHTGEVPAVLAAADLLVSPSRYEPYGLNVQEALARAVPAITSRRSGVSEKFPPELQSLLTENPDDIEELVHAIRTWRSDRWRIRTAVAALSAELRAYSWNDMARTFVAAVTDRREAETPDTAACAVTDAGGPLDAPQELRAE